MSEANVGLVRGALAITTVRPMPRLGTAPPVEETLTTGEDAVLARAEQLLLRNPRDLPVNRGLAALYLRKGALHRAVVRLKACFEIAPVDPAAMGLLTAYFQVRGEPHKALAVWRELIESAARRPDVAKIAFAKGAAAYRQVLGVLAVPPLIGSERGLDEIALADFLGVGAT